MLLYSQMLSMMGSLYITGF